MLNQTVLTASIVETGALRHTPAGLPALDLKLEHQSRCDEAGQPRQVALTLRALALGAVAERLGRQAPGSRWRFQGFLASPRGSKSVVLHIQDFQQD